MWPPVFVPYDIPFKNIQDMAYGTNEIVTYGMRSLPYGIILKGILKKLGLEKHGDILSRQGIASLGQELMNKFLAKAFE